MKMQKNIRNASARGGFTLLELMVAICVLGIISGWVAISWNNFVRHQEVRQEAGNLHKEILAMKARALESKQNADLTYDNSKFTVKYYIDDETAPPPDYQRRVQKEFSMNSKITIVSGDGACQGTGLPTIAENNWEDSITVNGKDNINAYNEGRIGVKSTSSKTEYCIIVGESNGSKSIKPELYQSSGNGKWIRM